MPLLTYQINRWREKSLYWLPSTFQVQTQPWPLMHPGRRKEGHGRNVERNKKHSSLTFELPRTFYPVIKQSKMTTNPLPLWFFPVTETHVYVWDQMLHSSTGGEKKMSHPLRRRERQNGSLFNMDLPSVVSYEVYEVELREVERIRNCQRSPEVYTLFNNHRRLTRPINRFLSTSHVERDAAVDIPVLQMRKLTQSMAKKCVRGHTAFKWQL